MRGAPVLFEAVAVLGVLEALPVAVKMSDVLIVLDAVVLSRYFGLGDVVVQEQCMAVAFDRILREDAVVRIELPQDHAQLVFAFTRRLSRLASQLWLG